MRLSLRQIGFAEIRPPSTGTSSSDRRLAAGSARCSIFWALASDTTDQSCQGLAATNAHGDDCQFFILALQSFSGSKSKDGVCGPNRMAQGDCTTVGVRLFWVQLCVANNCHSLCCEGFVQFDNIDRTWRGPGHFEELLKRRYRGIDRKSARLDSSHVAISYAVFSFKK